MELAPHVSPAKTATQVPFRWPDSAPDHVEAFLTYSVDTGERPVVHQSGTGETRRSGRNADYAVPIHDGRAIARELSLDAQGFALARHDTAVADFFDEEALRRIYYPEMERLVKAATGASRVLVFDHTLRVDDADAPEGTAVKRPVRMVHNDYTVKSAPQRVRDLLDAEEAEARLKNRFAVVNVWRPILGPARTSPLALADARSVAPKDLVPVDLVYPDRTGEIYYATFSPEHRWFYFPDMETHEVLLIKGYDSLDDGRARFAPHTAFDDPTSPPDAPPRQSIEIRSLAFFDS